MIRKFFVKVGARSPRPFVPYGQDCLTPSAKKRKEIEWCQGNDFNGDYEKCPVCRVWCIVYRVSCVVGRWLWSVGRRVVETQYLASLQSL
jgi:hypothetical protein